MARERATGRGRTGEVTSWTRCLSARRLANPAKAQRVSSRTDIQQDGSIVGLVDDMVVKDLIVQRSRLLDNSGHDGCRVLDEATVRTAKTREETREWRSW